MKKTAAALVVSVGLLGFIAPPTEAAQRGSINLYEFNKYAKQGKLKVKFERQVGAKGKVMRRAFRQKVIQYRGAGKLEGVRVAYYWDSRDGRWHGKHFRGFTKGIDA